VTEKSKSLLAFVFMFLALVFFGVWTARASEDSILVHNVNRFYPRPPKLEFSLYRTGPLEVAKVFGRSSGCQDADPELILETSSAALKTGLDPRIAAATIAVESNCNPYAVSKEGALGLMQVHVKTWRTEYDFSEVNLLNQHDNLQVGTEILSGLVRDYGVQEGIHRYNGLGVNCASCDSTYVIKILSLAGRK